MASWHSTVEFHSPCASSIGHTYSAHIGRRVDGKRCISDPFFLFFFLSFSSFFFFFFFFCSIEQSVTDRGPNVVNGYTLFIKSLENPSCSSWPSQWSNRAFLHTSCTFPKAVRYIFYNSFSICPILYRPSKVDCWDQTFPNRKCSRPSFATPCSRPTSSSLPTLWKVLLVSPRGFSLVANL